MSPCCLLLCFVQCYTVLMLFLLLFPFCSAVGEMKYDDAWNVLLAELSGYLGRFMARLELGWGQRALRLMLISMIGGLSGLGWRVLATSRWRVRRTKES